MCLAGRRSLSTDCVRPTPEKPGSRAACFPTHNTIRTTPFPCLAPTFVHEPHGSCYPRDRAADPIGSRELQEVIWPSENVYTGSSVRLPSCRAVSGISEWRPRCRAGMFMPMLRYRSDPLQRDKGRAEDAVAQTVTANMPAPDELKGGPALKTTASPFSTACRAISHRMAREPARFPVTAIGVC
jgi:hypothetical protein